MEIDIKKKPYILSLREISIFSVYEFPVPFT